MAVSVTDLVRSPSENEIRALVENSSNTHYWHYETQERANIMSLFYKGMEVTESDKTQLMKLLPKSASESKSDYSHRIDRTPVIPFEKKFVRAKERIFQGHGVTRDMPKSDMDRFWKERFDHFDDSGDDIDKFFRKKVFYFKEILGFGGIVVDLLMKEDYNEETGEKTYETFTDENGEAVPYPYLVRPEEIFNFGFYQGYLQFVIVRQNVKHEPHEYDYRYVALTPERIMVFNQELGSDETRKKNDGKAKRTELVLNEEHGFEKVPFVFIKGEEDMDSGYKIGRPERYSLIPMYRTALEIFYDLQEVSLLYGHPIPVMSENTVKELIGAVDDDGKYKPEIISAKLGAVVQIPENEEFPNQLFYQPDTQGLKHLKDYLFDIIESVHQFASIRDKSQIVANTSGVSKSLDTVEERGVLASSSREMESIERETLSIMASVRDDIDFDDEHITYQKEFDLSTASEHFDTMIEGMAQGALTYEMYKYHAIEGLRKSGAPTDKIAEVEKDLDEFGKPLKFNVSDLLSLVEGADSDVKNKLMDSLGKEIKILQNFVGAFSDEVEDDSDNQDFPEAPEEGENDNPNVTTE